MNAFMNVLVEADSKRMKSLRLYRMDMDLKWWWCTHGKNGQNNDEKFVTKSVVKELERKIEKAVGPNSAEISRNFHIFFKLFFLFNSDSIEFFSASLHLVFFSCFSSLHDHQWRFTTFFHPNLLPYPNVILCPYNPTYFLLNNPSPLLVSHM